MRPHLDARLATGWRYDAAAGAFVAGDGQRFMPGDSLPAGVEIRHTAPDLARSDPGSLSAAERDLAAYVQIIFPRGTRPGRYLDKVKRWPCVKEVREPPEISLP